MHGQLRKSELTATASGVGSVHTRHCAIDRAATRKTTQAFVHLTTRNRCPSCVGECSEVIAARALRRSAQRRRCQMARSSAMFRLQAWHSACLWLAQ